MLVRRCAAADTWAVARHCARSRAACNKTNPSARSPRSEKVNHAFGLGARCGNPPDTGPCFRLAVTARPGEQAGQGLGQRRFAPCASKKCRRVMANGSAGRQDGNFMDASAFPIVASRFKMAWVRYGRRGQFDGVQSWIAFVVADGDQFFGAVRPVEKFRLLRRSTWRSASSRVAGSRAVTRGKRTGCVPRVVAPPSLTLFRKRARGLDKLRVIQQHERLLRRAGAPELTTHTSRDGVSNAIMSGTLKCVSTPCRDCGEAAPCLCSGDRRDSSNCSRATNHPANTD